MGFRFRRSVSVLPGLRLNLGKRGISASIGVRGAHVTFGRTGTRTTVGIPGTGLSYTHLQTPHHRASTAPAAITQGPASPPSATRGFLWISLIAAIVISVVAQQIAKPPASTTVPTTASPPPAVATEAPSIKAAVLGLAQIRHRVANANTLTLTSAAVSPTGTICYQLRLRNSRNVPYVRNAVLEGSEVKVPGTAGFTALWNHRCTDMQGGLDITSKVEAATLRKPK